MFLLYFFTFLFLIVVGWLIYYTIQQNSYGQGPYRQGQRGQGPFGQGCPEDQPCGQPTPPRRCHQCGQPKPQCVCHKPCSSC